MTRVRDIASHLEQLAPLAYQESYDNAGLIVGDAGARVTGVLICLDVTEAVLAEAQAQHCNLIVAHHPIIFQPIKQLTHSGYAARCIIQAIKQDIAIYAIHTNLDSVAQGVNKRLAQSLNLQQLAILSPKSGTLSQLTTFVPPSALEPVLQALYQAGAGHMGNYTHCSFVSTGTGSFQPTAGAQPYIGTSNHIEKVTEHRVEVAFPTYLTKTILAALKQTHPYEEVAYYIQSLENSHPGVGIGMMGTLPQALPSREFLQYLQTQMSLGCVRHSAPITRPIQKIALCGGAGRKLLPEALRQQADAFITADVKYQDFFNAAGHILLADIGHYESELATKDLIYDWLSEKFANVTVLGCKTVTNPVHYC
ncbi:MAG: Nif3-like dinuclear metal center hexameric protein [Bacteroidota bacterium]